MGVAVALALPLFNVEAAQAVIFVENLSKTNNGFFGCGNFGTTNIVTGSSFTTDNDSYNLNFVFNLGSRL